VKTPPISVNALLALVGLIAGFCTPTANAQQTVPVTLKNGQLIEIVIVSLGGDHINWRYAGGGNVSKLPFKEIDGIEFPPTEAWAAAIADFDGGNYKDAAEKFKKLSLTKGPSTYYPAPGNFTNLAQRRLIDCYRRLRNAEDINLLRSKIEWDKISSSERKIGGVVACWGVAGSDDHEGALKIIEAESKKLDWTDPLRGELAYIRAIVHKRMGDEPLAAVAFGEAYGAYPGVDPSLSADAMKQAVTILSQYPDRKEEMNAVIHMYAGMYGDGKVWDDAPDDIVAVLSKEIEMLGISGPGKNKNTNKIARGRFVRIELLGKPLSLVEVEVFADGKNIASKGTPTQINAKAGMGPDRAIDGNTDGAADGKSYTMTNPAESDSQKLWWELDLKESAIIDKIVVWGREGKNAKGMLEGFDIMVFSEGRKETIFEKRDNKKVARKTEFILNEAKVLEEQKKAAGKSVKPAAEADAEKPKKDE